MITKVCLGLLFVNLLFISSSFCKSLQSKDSLTTTTKNPNSSSPTSILSASEISDQISQWSNLVKQLKVKKEEGEGIVRLGPLLTLTYKLHKFERDNQRLFESDKQLEKKLSALKNDIPEHVRSLIWGSKCAIRNAQDFENSLNIVQPSRNGQVKQLELGNGAKTYWKFVPHLESENLTFIIHESDNLDNLLGIKYVDKPLFGGWAHNGGILEIIPSKNYSSNGPEKMVEWNLEPIISDGGSSKGEVIYYMSTEYKHPLEPITFYFHESLQAAAIIRSGWEFDCL